MAELQIINSDFTSLKGQVVVITGGSSGIGLATTELLLSNGSHVVVGDRNPVPVQHPKLTFVETNVTYWAEILALFSTALDKHRRVDHVFANAGIGSLTDFLHARRDPSTTALLEPEHTCLDVNLRGCINTAYAGIHHMDPEIGGSIVCTASASSFQRFSGVDYAMAKHGVLGFVRGITAQLEAQGFKLRVNAIAPSWTMTGLVSPEVVEGAELKAQTPEAVARSVAILMVDENRKGQMIYSVQGKFFEVDEAVLLPAAESFVGDDTEEKGFGRVKRWLSR